MFIEQYFEFIVVYISDTRWRMLIQKKKISNQILSFGIDFISFLFTFFSVFGFLFPDPIHDMPRYNGQCCLELRRSKINTNEICTGVFFFSFFSLLKMFSNPEHFFFVIYIPPFKLRLFSCKYATLDQIARNVLAKPFYPKNV